MRQYQHKKNVPKEALPCASTHMRSPAHIRAHTHMSSVHKVESVTNNGESLKRASYRLLVYSSGAKINEKMLKCGFSIVLTCSSSAESDPVVTCWIARPMSAQSTRHGARPGPTLAPSCTRGPPACPAAESTRKEPRAKEKSFVWYAGEKSQFYTRST